MLNWQIDIRIDEPFQEPVQESWVRQAVREVVISEGSSDPVELSLLITDDTTLHELNRTYRGIDKTTDVLAFAFQEDTEFPSISDGITHLGEVIISCPQAAKQAEEMGHSLQNEVVVLVVHGVLHLLGYDHESSEDDEQMRSIESEILARLQS
ncbi:MAG: rRNA maturation RNase YbeY [Chloroflexi bacterium]|nr:rRNA maturation RNase YbeY [Chloroflexota bacterium]